MKKTTKLTIESERIFVIRGRNKQLQALCEACSKEVCLMTADEAAAVTQISSRAIYRMIEAGKVHFIETAEGSVLICFDSLSENITITRRNKLMAIQE